MGILAYPANYYGLVTGIIVIPTGLVFIPLLFLYYKSPYMTNRTPALVLISNLAYLALAGGSAISYLYFPESGCMFELWGRYLKFAVYGFSLLMRSWVYAFKYHHAQSQVNDIRISKFMAWALRNKWLISAKFLATVWIISFVIHMTIPAITMHYSGDLMKPIIETSVCSTYSYATAVNWSMPSVYAVAVLILLFSLHTTKDGYHIRDELRTVAIIWAVCTSLWLLTGVLPNSLKVAYYVPGFFWVQVSYILSFVVSTIWVWRLCREHEYLSGTTRADDPELEPTTGGFAGLLRNEAFRKEFCNFLCLQFCVENLFFWEAVQQFHRVSPHDMKSEAKVIYNKYILSGAPCEVNIPMTVKKSVEAQIKEGVISDTTFDDAASQTLRLMELDSYPRFTLKAGNAPSKTGSQNRLL